MPTGFQKLFSFGDFKNAFFFPEGTDKAKKNHTTFAVKRS